jgi:hypothetical protein
MTNAMTINELTINEFTALEAICAGRAPRAGLEKAIAKLAEKKLVAAKADGGHVATRQGNRMMGDYACGW